MPGAKERELRRRIGSIGSTKKITRAMELIAATRVVKAMQRAQAASPYSKLITSVIEDLASAGVQVEHPLMRQASTVGNVGIIVIAGDRGLAGPYNTSIMRSAERRLMSHRSEGRDYSLFCVGRKSARYFRFRNYRVDFAVSGFSDNPSYDDARRIAEAVQESFVAEETDQIELIYTEFLSMGIQQVVVVRRFLPLVEFDTIATEHVPHNRPSAKVEAAEYEFEPSADAVLTALLPRYIEARLYGALLEAAASEHANRQRAMKAATDNAAELITNLTREMNQARQDSVTAEIMEIVGGAEALSHAHGEKRNDAHMQIMFESIQQIEQRN